MPDVQTSTTSDPRLALRAIIDHELKTFPIRDGMVIGSHETCTVRAPGAQPRHLRVRIADGFCRLCPADPEIKLQDIDARPCAWLPLRNGSIFAAGKTIFDCVDLGRDDSPDEANDPSIRESCPRCRENLLLRDVSSNFCPHCGAPLPPDCPAWPVVNDDAKPQAAPAIRWWMRWMPLWLRARVARDPLFFARRTTVLAYINTLFNLGLKYDAGVDTDPQLPEAMRYYRKAAQLGNVPARARLKVKAARVWSPFPPGEG